MLKKTFINEDANENETAVTFPVTQNVSFHKFFLFYMQACLIKMDHNCTRKKQRIAFRNCSYDDEERERGR